jgi:2',3'-cyclic-nucleotide 2'-phosphodiesterase (5'-nucleotidase family)
MNHTFLSRRHFLGSTLGWLGSTGLGLTQSGAETESISIFHTTDLHGNIVPTTDYDGNGNLGGFARCAGFIREGRRNFPKSLVVDIGDVYQGTAESLSNQGRLMIGLFNQMGYDAWTLGNHDFDWGREALEGNLGVSNSPILTGNIEVGGKSPRSVGGVWEKVVPWVIKEVGGFKIALIGLVTPGLPYWLSPETLAGISVQDPVISLQKSVDQAKAAGANAIVVTAHMGYRPKDDFGNPMGSMLKGVKGIDVLLGGHTHQSHPSRSIGEVLYSQSSYFGIHCGRVELVFDRNSRKLIGKSARTTLMDSSFELDPGVMNTAQPELKKAEEQLARKVGTVTKGISGKGRGNRLVNLFCECFAESLARIGHPVDGVFHGTFGTGDLEPGELTVADCWKMLPYENLLSTAELTAKELIEIVREDSGERNSDRTLWPFDLKLSRDGTATQFTFKGEPVAPDRRFVIGLNSYDAQSGGRRLMKLREIVGQPGAKRTVTSIDTRSSLIEGLLNRGNIS